MSKAILNWLGEPTVPVGWSDGVDRDTERKASRSAAMDRFVSLRFTLQWQPSIRLRVAGRNPGSVSRIKTEEGVAGIGVTGLEFTMWHLKFNAWTENP